jgi:hypothetical protein
MARTTRTAQKTEGTKNSVVAPAPRKWVKRKGFRTPAEEERIRRATPAGQVEKCLRKVARMVTKRQDQRAADEVSELLEETDRGGEHRTGRRVEHGIGNGINIPAKAVALTGPNGRPAIYDPYRFPHIAYVLCKERGFTNEELARVFDVSRSTVNQWMWQHDEFKKCVKRGRDEYDSENVENALKKRALGYSYTETHRTRTKLIGVRPNGVEVTIPALSITTVEKEVAADPRSIMYWLQNRQPERWRNTIKIDIAANKAPDEFADQELAIEDMSTEALLLLRDMAGKAAELQSKTIDVTPEKRQMSVQDILEAADKANASR